MKILLADGTKLNPPFTSGDTDRHGNVRIYVRRGRRKVRLREMSSAEAF